MSPHSGRRAVGAIRLSSVTDATTSPDRQQAAIGGACNALGLSLVGMASDLNVSASKVSPFDRPELGAWLRRPNAFDALVWWRLDRAVRSMADMAELGKWARTHRKRLIFAEGPSGGAFELDMGSPVGELLMMVLAFAAQMEAQAIQERVQGARAALRTMRRWPGGQPPYGYVLIPNPDGPGFVLGEDPETAPVVRDLARRLQEDGESLTSLAKWLTANPDTPSPRDHRRRAKGRPEDGSIWNVSTVRHILTTPATLGYLLHEKKPIRDPETGEPIQVGPPLLDPATHAVVKAKIEARGAHFAGVPRNDTHALLFGVVLCAGCGQAMYYDRMQSKAAQKQKRRPRYLCKPYRKSKICTAASSIVAEPLEEYVIKQYLDLFGHLPEFRTETIPGYDPAHEIAQVTAELEDHMSDRAMFTSAAGKASWQKRASSLEARLEFLESQEATPEQETRVYTGTSHAEAWEAVGEDVTARRNLLIQADMSVIIGPSYSTNTKIFQEERIRIIMPDQKDYEAAADAAQAVADELDIP
ncbi:recombinase family protein [Nocardiopsis alba]|uniref:recombinase family protein n=1 Tax=Nocardiopsis alba TaxID=53437 RepID=UPI0038284E6C